MSPERWRVIARTDQSVEVQCLECLDSQSADHRRHGDDWPRLADLLALAENHRCVVRGEVEERDDIGTVIGPYDRRQRLEMPRRIEP